MAKFMGLMILNIALIIGIIFYVTRRLSWAFSINPKLLGAILGLAVVLFIVVLMTVMRQNQSSVFSSIIYNISIIGFGTFALLFVSLLVTDIVQFAVHFSPRNFGLIVVGLTSLLTLYSLFNADNTKVIHQQIEIKNVKKPFRMALLSDIHIGHYWGKRSVEKIVNKVKKENVDIVVITGDLFDGRVRLNKDVLSPLSELNLPIYFVSGNHDLYSGDSDIKRLLKESGITTLENHLIDFDGVQIIGLDYMVADREARDMHGVSGGAHTIKDILPKMGIDDSKPSILLHHNPVGVKYAVDNGIDLYLAGHTHAGQLFPATLIAKGMFEYNKGLYKTDDTQVYVSQGIGTFGPPMRLGTNSEITILDIK